MSARLHLVPACTAAPCRRDPSPEARLRALFRREARILKALADVRAELDAERRRHADTHGMVSPARLERLRTQFGPAPKVGT
jgi:hypothetical protein